MVSRLTSPRSIAGQSMWIGLEISGHRLPDRGVMCGIEALRQAEDDGRAAGFPGDVAFRVIETLPRDDDGEGEQTA